MVLYHLCLHEKSFLSLIIPPPPPWKNPCMIISHHQLSTGLKFPMAKSIVKWIVTVYLKLPMVESITKMDCHLTLGTIIVHKMCRDTSYYANGMHLEEVNNDGVILLPVVQPCLLGCLSITQFAIVQINHILSLLHFVEIFMKSIHKEC